MTYNQVFGEGQGKDRDGPGQRRLIFLTEKDSEGTRSGGIAASQGAGSVLFQKARRTESTLLLYQL